MIKAGDLVLIWNPKKGDSFLIRVTPGASLGTHFGQISHNELMNHEFGEGIWTPRGEIYYVIHPTLGNYTRRLKRQTQIIFPKDAGFIIEHLNFFPGCQVVECGTGSGSLCCTFAHFIGDSGKVHTYDRRPEFSAIARKNAEKWGVADRIEFNIGDLADGFKERDADAVYLDVPDPWNYIDKAYETLKPGCHLGILVPTANQISETLTELQKFNFVDVEVCEIMLRYFKTDPKRIRPQDMMIGHTGYLIFGVKTLPLPEPPVVEEKDDKIDENAPADKESAETKQDEAQTNTAAQNEELHESPAEPVGKTEAEEPAEKADTAEKAGE